MKNLFAALCVALAFHCLPVHADATDGTQSGASLMDGSTPIKALVQHFGGRYGPCAVGSTMTASTISVASGDNSFNDSANGFAALGLIAGSKLKVAGLSTTANDGVFTVVIAAAGKITVAESLTTETAGDSATLTTGECPLNTYHFPLDKIGFGFSTSNFRLFGGTSFPDNGVPFYFTHYSDLTPKYGNATTADSFADWSVISGAPGTTQYPKICMDDWAGHFTSIFGGAWDLQFGCIKLRYSASSVCHWRYNTVSILLQDALPDCAEQFGFGQIMSAGQIRLHKVKTNPAWNRSADPSETVGDLTNTVAVCRNNGQGSIMGANDDTWKLQPLVGCLYHVAGASGSVSRAFVLGTTKSGQVSAITQGAAYPGCAALPCANGSLKTYLAGNYVVITVPSLPNLETGDPIFVSDVETYLGSNLNGWFICKLLTSTTCELHQEVSPQGMGPPSSFVFGDSVKQSSNGIYYAYLSEITLSATPTHLTNPQGFEITNESHPRLFVGAGFRNPGDYPDSPCARDIASWYGRRSVSAQCSYTSAHTGNSATSYTEPSSENRITFWYLGPQSEQGDISDTAGEVPWSATAVATNDSTGCYNPVLVAAGTNYFVGQTINPAGGTSTAGCQFTLTAIQAVSATVAAGGSGCVGSGTKTLTATTGTGTKPQIDVTVSGGVVTAVVGVHSGAAGNLTANMTDNTHEPMTGASCVGVQLNIVPGALAASATTTGVYSVAASGTLTQASTSGSGTGATWTATWSTLPCNFAVSFNAASIADGNTMTASTISVAASDNSFNDSGSGFGALSLLAGNKLKVAGLSTAANDGTFTVRSATAGKIVVAEPILTETAGDSATFTTTTEPTIGIAIGRSSETISGSRAWLPEGLSTAYFLVKAPNGGNCPVSKATMVLGLQQ
jgi:hypothetical protein